MKGRCRAAIGSMHSTLRSDRGAIAIILALIIPVFMLGLAIVSDVGVWRYRQRVVQGAADAAAVSAELDLISGRSMSQINQSVLAEALRNGWKGTSSGTITIHSPPTSGALNGVSGAVEVILTENGNRLFSGFVRGAASTGLTGRAVANATTTNRTTSTGMGCMLALSTTTSNGFTVAGGTTLPNAACEYYTNSPANGGATVEGGSSVAGNVKAVGTVVVKGGGTVGASVNGVSSVSDPYGSPAINGANSAAGPCKEPDSNQVSWGSGVSTVSPGHWCNNWKLATGTTLNLLPGIYYLGNTSATTAFFMNGGTINALGGVTLVMVNIQYASGFFTTGGATINIAAPTTGPTAGLAIVQNSDTTYPYPSQFTTASNLNFTGTIRLPWGSFGVSNGTLATINGANGCGQVIASTVSTNGGSVNIGNQCSAQGLPGFGTIVTTSAPVATGGATIME